MKTTFLSAALLSLSATTSVAQQAFDATLTAHAELPAASFVPAPEGAPAHFNVSGRFTGPEGRVTDLYANVQDNGQALPFPGQPLQGFSGIRSLGEGRFLVLTDNGFGSKANSSDVILMFNIVRPDWDSGRIAIERTVRLSDPDQKVPFPIMNEASQGRFLTGADFDVESIQPVSDTYWIGDEFGPWLLQVDADGKVLQVLATEPGGTLMRSPDNAFVAAADPGASPAPEVITFRSGGYEGMALSEDQKTLYPLLEKPVWDAATGTQETVNGVPVLRLMEVSTETGEWGDRVRYYPLEAAGHAIGDFNLVDGTRGLIIERDNGEGDPREGWAETPAAFKRIYLVDLERTDENGVLEKIAYIDLMNIRDPEGVAPRGTIDGVFSFPFVTIENVDRVDQNHIVVANDNNFPFSVGRQQGRADDNEMILLEVGAFLNAD
ncbi:esterase-like activity of phytase family protein [Paracoccus rhizosphaerae]|uniref:Esterase-like activity of phytase family protein n=1 Tax=Paracoccus rhizosphaerae TaxID=1133347 RepID=A0ABV6CLZ5_9RHOB|nr:esterase-like activity of phytase family protein [Paracoccus rhizosphaerae]